MSNDPPASEERYELGNMEHEGERTRDAMAHEIMQDTHDNDNHDENQVSAGSDDLVDEKTRRSTLRKLDFILLPFLALLFLLNSMDKSNIGNAETAGFTKDAGLSPSDLNTSMAIFFTFFVTLQPVGAALGRRFGMRRWVPACMSLWGLCTICHIWVRHKWQLILLRIAIASLEAGFYPTAVSYLSLFYTRYEFAVRLGFFYGQSAVAGALGGVLSWLVYSQFPHQQPDDPQTPPPQISSDIALIGGWKSWQVLFLVEGCVTMVVALTGFLWLPRSADSAWFFNPKERQWAEQRIRMEKDENSYTGQGFSHKALPTEDVDDGDVAESLPPSSRDDSRQLLGSHRDDPDPEVQLTLRNPSATSDSGLSRQDVLSAFLNIKIWHLLICNILSAIPAAAFGIFLPLVIKELSPAWNLSPAASNLLTAPPFAIGAIVLYIFTFWSDRSRQRLIPILWSLTILLIGLTLTVLIPMRNYVLRYISLCILLSGTFIASPLTVAWLANNTPETGKRAILLGINGWGNLAGAISSLMFTPQDEKAGYIHSFIATLICVVVSFAGFAGFSFLLVRENRWRDEVTAEWSEEDLQREDKHGDVRVSETKVQSALKRVGVDRVWQKLGYEDVRRGDERMTFRYGY